MEADWSRLARPVPSWFTEARFGVFIHWGPYSVPAWAEPRGELGTIPDREWFARNPYAEWYWNSLKIPDSPTADHHRRTYGDAPYEAFLDAWAAERFDADELMALIGRAGARYVVPTTKHHDGVALWPAPGSGTRNTATRGPRRDLITEIATAARRRGLRFGTYYSGGLDWGFAPGPPIESRHDFHRPVDERYAAYAYRQVVDLIDRFRPDILWNDIDWPDAGKTDSPLGLFDLLGRYRAAVPDGVINDRWGVPLSDFRTSEYQQHLDNEAAPAWEHCRGIGLSFGYNQLEGENQYLTPRQAVRLLVDVVSRRQPAPERRPASGWHAPWAAARRPRGSGRLDARWVRGDPRGDAGPGRRSLPIGGSVDPLDGYGRGGVCDGRPRTSRLARDRAHPPGGRPG